jgi:D-glycero-alpha-D-manno-heptose-7-phosphate kinase
LIIRTLQEFNIDPAYVVTNSAVPQGSGLGASSSLLCSLIASITEFSNQELDPAVLLKLAQHIETQHLDMPTGIQDYYPAVYGGLNRLEFSAGKLLHHHDQLSPKFISDLESSVILCHTGVSHLSGTDNWNTLKHRIEDPKNFKSYWDDIANLSLSISDAILDEDITQLGELIRSEWNIRQKLHPSIFNKNMRRMVSEVEEFTYGMKACGAGNGGVMMLFVDKTDHDIVIDRVQQKGGKVLDWKIDRIGLSPQ